MPLCDDLKLPLTDEELSRRRFLGLLGSGALGVAGLGTGISGLRYLEPAVFFEEDTRVGVGRPEDIPVGTVLVLPKQRIFVVRTSEGFFALSSVCTHLGCMTRYERELGELACPCHGSRYQLDGQVKQGPAPRALPRLQITVERGLLVVDSGRRVSADAILKVA
jgi:nitrite reductase/ring-hydroxylating ferredoxin subunit